MPKDLGRALIPSVAFSMRVRTIAGSTADGAGRWCDFVRWSYEILQRRCACFRMTKTQRGSHGFVARRDRRARTPSGSLPSVTLVAKPRATTAPATFSRKKEREKRPVKRSDRYSFTCFCPRSGHLSGRLTSLLTSLRPRALLRRAPNAARVFHAPHPELPLVATHDAETADQSHLDDYLILFPFWGPFSRFCLREKVGGAVVALLFLRQLCRTDERRRASSPAGRGMPQVSDRPCCVVLSIISAGGQLAHPLRRGLGSCAHSRRTVSIAPSILRTPWCEESVHAGSRFWRHVRHDHFAAAAADLFARIVIERQEKQ